ncbi:MAG: TerB family tellurite resistance protein [Pedobacter sp.]|nr:MAG: TerB family tellurite resistance protein [Pedobacter sp.]
MGWIRIWVCLLVFWAGVFGSGVCHGQSQEAKQLLLNVEKLSQLKNILKDMKTGYQILSKGYNSVRDIAKGNFSLHEVFLDGLLVVSPEVKKYVRIADILSDQKAILSEYQSAFARFQSSDLFSEGELAYLASVYENLFKKSLENLEDLAMVITSSKLRMSDDERLQAIDRIFLDTRDKLVFVRDFNAGASLLMAQKQKEKREIGQLKSWYKLN